MASIRKRGDRWHVQVRKKGHPTVTKTFSEKKHAEVWARRMETLADFNDPAFGHATDDCPTLNELLDRYVREVVVHKRGAEIEQIIIRAFQRQSFCSLPANKVTPALLAAYRDKRLKKVKPATLSRELGVIQHAYRIAMDEWGLPIAKNPLQGLRKPPIRNRRERRLKAGEEQRLIEASSVFREEVHKTLWRFALATGMRRGEIVSIRWEHVEWEERTLRIPMTKNGYARTIPLSNEAVTLLRGRQEREPQSVGPYAVSTEAVKLAWRRVTKAAGTNDLHFHDLRHEAISRFFEMGLSLPEVALISGHRDPRMLFRYRLVRASMVTEKLNSNEIASFKGSDEISFW